LPPQLRAIHRQYNGQSIEVVLCGQEHDGPTAVYEGDLSFGYRSFPATRELLMHKFRIKDLYEIVYFQEYPLKFE